MLDCQLRHMGPFRRSCKARAPAERTSSSNHERPGQRQAKIMIAKKMRMTIGETRQSAMILSTYPAELNDQVQRRHAYMEKARACRATIEKYALSTEDVCIKLLT